MAFDTPQSTNEAILQNMLGASNALKPPQSRVEKLLQELSGQMPEANPSEGTTTGTLERLKIGDDIYTVEGGGSGTSDYDALNNKPQIASVTLSGDKSLADLGIASATTVSGILDGTDIDSFGDVETALAGKQDTLTFDNVPTENSNNPVKSGGVKSAIDAAVSRCYHHAGTKTCAELVAGLLVAANEGNVYNMTDSGTTTADFIEGAGQPIKAGDNVGIAKISDGVYKFDLLSGFVDTANFVQKSETAGLLKNDGTVDTTIQGDVSTLKSGLTTLDNEVNGDATVYPYADVITISDAVPANVADCSVKIEPVQDLHGYDHPWVGGAGKNKWSLSNSYTSTSSGQWVVADLPFALPAGTYTISIADDSTSQNTEFVFKNADGQTLGNPTLVSNGARTRQTFTYSEDIAKVAICMYGDARTISDIQIEEGSTATAFAPYTNICPISGNTESVVTMAGKNLADPSDLTPFSAGWGNCPKAKVFPGKTYTISLKYLGSGTQDGASRTIKYYKDGTWTTIATETYANITTVGYTYTVPSGVYKIGINGADFVEYGVQIEEGSYKTEYVAPNIKTYTIALGDTIYGGTVNFNSGVMTVTHAVVDMGTLSWNKIADGLYRAEQSGMKNTADNEIADILCETYFPSMYGSLPWGSIALRYTNQIWVRDSTVADATEMTTNLNGKELCYPLGTPFTVQLTPQQIQLLKGTNTITASTGQISVTANGVSGSIGQVQEKVNDHEERIEDLESGLDTVKSGLTNVSSTIEELQAYTGYSSTDIIGIEVDYVNKSFRRLGAAVGKNGGSDFDSFPMFGGRRRCNVADDGTVSKYYGDTGYAEDGTNGQVMVYQPKFYYKMVPLKLEKQSTGKGYHIRKAAYYVTATPMKGFKVHPAFVNASGNEVDYILVGASKGCIYDVSESTYILDDAQVMDNTEDKFSSIFGVKPASGLTQDLTRPKIEQMCQNRGANWHELNVQMASMTQLLMLIEYGKFDMQRAIGKGVVDIADNSSYNCGATSGSTSALGNASGRATSTTIVTNTSTTYTYDGKTSVTYRGEEDPYGDMWEFVIGMNIYGNGSMNGGEPYICSDYNYAESKNTDNYKGAGFTVANSDGYVNAWGYGSEDFDWLFIASEVGGSDALPVGDYLWKTANLNGYRIALLGADWVDAWTAGGFGWALNVAVGTGNRYVAGRLAYIPA